jgi:broad specificity phosphatase PhoE
MVPSRPSDRFFILTRHAESTANRAQVVNSDPSKSLPLTARGKEQARTLGEQLTNLEIDLAVGTRFLRTQETIDIALHDRGVPILIEPGFDEVQAGDMEGAPMEVYWSWKEEHDWDTQFPRGESVNDALRRYAAAIKSVLDRSERVTLIVGHEFGLRSVATGAARGAFPLTQFGAWEHAVPYLFDAHALCGAAARLTRVAASQRGGTTSGSYVAPNTGVA